MTRPSSSNRDARRDPRFEERRAGADNEEERLGAGAIAVVVLSALVIMLLIQTFVARLYLIPSASMEPTLHGCPGCTNDRIAVEKLSYLVGDPRPGDVVVFAGTPAWNVGYEVETSDNVLVRGLQNIAASFGIGANPENILVKRVIATGGQVVSCQAGDPGVMVDGQPLQEPYLQNPAVNPVDPATGSEACGGAYFGPVQVPEDSLWVMGDNRTNSLDSRAHLGDDHQGTIPLDNVRGKVMGIVLPVSRFGGIEHSNPQISAAAVPAAAHVEATSSEAR